TQPREGRPPRQSALRLALGLIRSLRPAAVVDNLRHGVILVECLRPYGCQIELSEPYRTAPGHTRHADSLDPVMGASAWTGIGQAIRANSGELLQVEAGSLLPSLASARETGLARFGMGAVREQAARQVLPAQGVRKKTAILRALKMEGASHSNHSS